MVKTKATYFGSTFTICKYVCNFSKNRVLEYFQTPKVINEICVSLKYLRSLQDISPWCTIKKVLILYDLTRPTIRMQSGERMDINKFRLLAI